MRIYGLFAESRAKGMVDMEKKHIAMFISSLNKGGSERVLVNLAEYFYSRGYAVTIVTQYKSENEYGISDGIRRVFRKSHRKKWGTGEFLIFSGALPNCGGYGKRKSRI